MDTRGMKTALLALAWLFTALAVLASGCSYSFTGSSVPPHLKTIGIPFFEDQSGFGEPGLREKLTNKLIDLFVQDNSLAVADRSHSDSILEGVIVAVRDEPSVVTQGEAVTKRRMTITVKATFQDMKLKRKVWEKQFSDWGDYDISGGPTARQSGIDAAIEKLAEDVLLETVSGW
jgi:hypothetical protein